ncbi:Gfo/Idh/MocA family protein [Pelagicoccus mobilis]|uniref:Gfo/Idh/MocA family oxidoreductase n=1 Tax=Pelagicoccus mobilis TaxID=415221 RepID=A0A934RR34_9BACT|nr:Gfo/Idh/MocA family oxidoreductase [Pelagicoccus mobilis]MBK1875995.1 Gfo/Idh/MocA family oxidoreductase [Pelagicoccus mobilis]
MTPNVSRRGFVQKAAIAAAGSLVIPRFSIAKSLGVNNKLNVACVGISHMGKGAVKAGLTENLVALCDVDWRRDDPEWKFFPNDISPAEIADQNPQAKTFSDFREMLHDMGDKIDVVMVSTPDHTHFPATMAAMEAGKHVFVQKPMAHNIWQVRTMQKAAQKYGVQTVMGNQGHTFEGARLIVEWFQAGVLGEVREVHCWTDRPEPTYFPRQKQYPPVSAPVPEGLDWKLWQGPIPEKEFSPIYAPTTWRGWWDYGVGAMGDIGCHCLDTPFWALELGMPTKVEVELAEPANKHFTPKGAHLIYHFPARGKMPPVKLHWYEGTIRPPKLPGMDTMPSNGMYMIGSEETVYHEGMRPESPMLWPRKNMAKYGDLLKKRPLPRVKGGPHKELLNAIKGGPTPGSNFDYAAPLTEVVLLGGLAIRSGKTLKWNAKKMKITNHKEVNAFVKEPVRKGWEYGEDLW